MISVVNFSLFVTIFYLYFYLFVKLPYDIFMVKGFQKTDAARIAQLDLQMFQDESWKPTYCGVKRWKVKVTSHKNITGVGLCTLVSAGFFWSSVYLLKLCNAEL